MTSNTDIIKTAEGFFSSYKMLVIVYFYFCFQPLWFSEGIPIKLEIKILNEDSLKESGGTFLYQSTEYLLPYLSHAVYCLPV